MHVLPRAEGMDDAVAVARTWLGNPVRVHLSDGRVLVGRLWCLDAHANIVLVSAEEYAPPDVVAKESSVDRLRRFMGQVLVSKSHLVKFETAATA